MSEFGGGGLNLIVCQLVDCKFCKNIYLPVKYTVSIFHLDFFLLSVPQSGPIHFRHPDEFSPQTRRADLG